MILTYYSLFLGKKILMTLKPGINKKKTVGCFTNYFSIHTQVHKDKNAPSDRIRTHFAKKKNVFLP